MKQKIILDILPPGLNGSDGLIREHYFQAKDRKESYSWLIASKNPKKHTGRVRITYTRRSVRMMDPDNTAASFKHLGDALENLGVIKEDSWNTIAEFNVRWEKANSIDQQKTIIEICDVE